jgi:hypothetical protein
VCFCCVSIRIAPQHYFHRCERERDRERETHTHTHIHTYIHTHISIYIYIYIDKMSVLGRVVRHVVLVAGVFNILLGTQLLLRQVQAHMMSPRVMSPFATCTDWGSERMFEIVAGVYAVVVGVLRVLGYVVWEGTGAHIGRLVVIVSCVAECLRDGLMIVEGFMELHEVTCVYMCIYVHVYVYIYIYICVCVCVCLCCCAGRRALLFVCDHTRINLINHCILFPAVVLSRVCSHTLTHTHTHTTSLFLHCYTIARCVLCFLLRR